MTITCEKREDPPFTISLPENWSYVSPDKYDSPPIKAYNEQKKLTLKSVFTANPYGVATMPYALLFQMDMPRIPESEIPKLNNIIKERIPNLLGHPDVKKYTIKEISWDNEKKQFKIDAMRVYNNGSTVNAYYRYYYTQKGVYFLVGMARSSETEFNELLKETMSNVTFGRNVRYRPFKK